MKASFPRQPLADAVVAVGPAVYGKTFRPVLRCALLAVPGDDLATLTATDLDIAIRCELPGVRCDRPGSVLLDHARLSAIFAAGGDAEGEVAIEDDGTHVRLVDGRSRYRLAAADLAECPVPEWPDFAAARAVPAGELARAIRRTAWAADRAGYDTMRHEGVSYGVGGVIFRPAADGRIEVSAVDGRVAARCWLPRSDGEGPALPAAASLPGRPLRWVLARAARLPGGEPVPLAFGGPSADLGPTWAALRLGTAAIRTRLVEGRLPLMPESLLGRAPGRFTVAVGALRDAVARAAVMTAEESRAVELALAGGVLRLRARTADVGESEAEIEVAAEGPGATALVQAPFLSAALKALDPGDEVAVELGGDSPAVVLRAEGWDGLIATMTRED